MVIIITVAFSQDTLVGKGAAEIVPRAGPVLLHTAVVIIIKVVSNAVIGSTLQPRVAVVVGVTVPLIQPAGQGGGAATVTPGTPWATQS